MPKITFQATNSKFTDICADFSPWKSPSDFLIGKVALAPPFTQKHRQALTHQGIMALGGEVETKFIHDMEVEKQKALLEREDFLNRMFKAKKVDLARNFHEQEALKRGEEMDQIRLKYENKICELLWECFKQVKDLEEQMQIEYESLNTVWKTTLEDEIENTVERITVEFLEKLRIQEKKLLHMFNNHITDLKTKQKLALYFEKIKCKEMIIQMKHKLYCDNISNLMYLLCKERRQCKTQKIQIEDDFVAKIHQLHLITNQKGLIVRKLTKIKNRDLKELCLKERCLMEVLRQFQKFMYLALQSAPTRGSFLMNLYKLVKRELEDYCLHSEPPITTKKTSKERKVEKVCQHVDSDEFLKYSTYSTDNPDDAEDTPPVFYFNKETFVREDFTTCQEIQTESELSLWNPEVDELLKIFRSVIETKRSVLTLPKIKSHQSSVHFNKKEQLQPSGHTPSDISMSIQLKTVSPEGSKVHQKILDEKLPTVLKTLQSLADEEEKEIRKVSLDPDKDEAKLPKTINKADEFAPRQMTPLQSRLSLARDSITLTFSMMEKKSLQRIERMAMEEIDKFANEEYVKEYVAVEHMHEIDDEHDTKVTEKKNENLDDTNTICSVKSLDNKATSKIVLACDSYEIIKSTLNFASVKDKELTEITGRPKSQLTFSTEVSKTHIIQPLQPPTSHRMDETVRSTPRSKAPSLKKFVWPQKPVSPPKPRPVTAARIAGSRKMKEYKKTVTQFTNERITDLVHTMKMNPSVIPLFTPCLK